MGMYSKNIIGRMFPALNEDAEANRVIGRYAGGDLTDEQTPTSPDLAPILASLAAASANGGGGDNPQPAAAPLDLSLYSDVARGAGGQPDAPPTAIPSQPTAEEPMDISGAARSDDPNANNFGWNSNAGWKPADPYAGMSPRQIKKAELDELVNQKVVDHNHGLKGRIWEGIQNALAGISMVYAHDPKASWQEELAGAGGGVAHGLIDKTWNEKRQQDRKIAETEGDYNTLAKADEIESKLSDADTERQARVYNALTAREKADYDKLETADKRIIDVYKEADDVSRDSKDPDIQALYQQADARHIVLPPKKKGDKFTLQISPDGRPVIMNTSSGAYHLGAGNFAKPTTISKADIPYSFFGIDDDKTLDDRAAKAVAPDFPHRRVRPEIAKALAAQTADDGSHPYQNADGSFNETKAVADGVFDPTTGYEAQGSDYEQRKAAARDKLRSKQSDRQKAVDELASALMTHKPTADNPTPKSLHDVMSIFKDVLDTKDQKKRSEAIKYFYSDVLPKIRIQ